MSTKLIFILALILALAAVFTIAIAAPFTADRWLRLPIPEARFWWVILKAGPWRELKKGDLLPEGKFIKTGEKGLVELTVPDKSVVRLAPETLYKLDQVFFPAGKPRRFSARLFLGRLWARVRIALGKARGTFDTKIPTAVVGVRGTVFNVKTAADRSADILVYEGLVGVGPPLIIEGGPKEEIKWPVEVSEKKWEEIILTRLQKLHIYPDGTPGKPESFEPAREEDEWVRWNQERDRQSITKKITD